MLGEVFYWLFNMSIVTVLTGLPVLLIRQIKRIPKRVTVFLWAIPFLRMVVPFGLGSPYSLLSPLSEITVKTVVVHQFAEGFSITGANCAMGAKSYFPITYRTEMLEQVFSVASVLWVIVAVHWFNPVCWLFLKCFLSDLELACDERVVAKIGAQQAKKYASVLLDCKQGTTVFASAFGGAKIRTRIENILSFKKMTRFSAVVSVILLSVIFYVLLTNAE